MLDPSLCVACGTKLRWWHLGKALMGYQGEDPIMVHNLTCWRIIASLYETGDQKMAALYGIDLK